MTFRYLTAFCVLLLCASVSIGTSGTIRAQGGDPFGAGGGGDPFGGGGGGDPFGGGAPTPTPTPGPGTPAGVTPSDDPVVLAIRESDPRSPDQLMRSAEQLINYGEPSEAKVYLRRLMNLGLDKRSLAALHNQFGSDSFHALINNPKLAPEGDQLGNAVMDAAYEEARDPARLKQTVKDLSDPSFGVRRSAVTALTAAGDIAVPALMEALVDPTRSAEYTQVRSALVAFKALSEEALIGALETDNFDLKTQVILALGQMRSRNALPHLVEPFVNEDNPEDLRKAARYALLNTVGALPTEDDAVKYLHKKSMAYFQGEPPREVSFDDTVILYHWNPEKQESQPSSYYFKDAALVMAAKVTADLYAIDSQNREYARLFVATNLETAKVINGYETPLPQGPNTAHGFAAATGVENVEDVLEFALKHKRIGAAVGAAEVLGDLKSKKALLSANGYPRPLAEAMRHSNRRVRFAAATAALKIKPEHAFPGASHVMETLSHVAGTVAERHVVVGHPREIDAQSLVGLLSQSGWDGDIAPTGKMLFELAVNDPDLEFILIHDAIDRTDARETLQMLRRDPRTAAIPVGLMAREDRLHEMRKLAETDSLTYAFPRPHTTQDLIFQARRLIQLNVRDQAPLDERFLQAKIAIGFIDKILESPDEYPYVNRLRAEAPLIRAMFAPDLAQDAATALGKLGTPKSQSALLDVASENARPLSERTAASKAFDVAVRSRGLLISTKEIETQYQRYNQSRNLPPETQQVLASLLDAIEAPTAAPQPVSDEAPGATEE